MSIIKQTIYQSRKNKEKELEIKLYNLKNLLVDFEACDYFGIYKSDDCDDEFLVYEEWKSEEDYIASQDSEAYKSFQKTYDELVLKKHNLLVF